MISCGSPNTLKSLVAVFKPTATSVSNDDCVTLTDMPLDPFLDDCGESNISVKIENPARKQSILLIMSHPDKKTFTKSTRNISVEVSWRNLLETLANNKQSF
jgi:hypothetical protein